jgi:general stress protein YciG
MQQESDMPKRPKGPPDDPGNGEAMSVREAGRKGGNTTRERYGSEFFQEIGAKGGRTVSERYSNEHFREIGRKGGRRVAELIARAKGMDEAADQPE